MTTGNPAKLFMRNPLLFPIDDPETDRRMRERLKNQAEAGLTLVRAGSATCCTRLTTFAKSNGLSR